MPTKPLNFETVYIPSNKVEEGSEESEEPSQKFSKQFHIISKQVLVGNVLDDFTEHLTETLSKKYAKPFM